jgi:hypothetical protein
VKFRKRPVVIEAEQWSPGKEVDGVVMYQPPDAVIGNRGGGEQRFPQDAYPVVNTLEGRMKVTPGDWIITGIKGEKYPCKPDIFEATYELVSD